MRLALFIDARYERSERTNQSKTKLAARSGQFDEDYR